MLSPEQDLLHPAVEGDSLCLLLGAAYGKAWGLLAPLPIFRLGHATSYRSKVISGVHHAPFPWQPYTTLVFCGTW